MTARTSSANIARLYGPGSLEDCPWPVRSGRITLKCSVSRTATRSQLSSKLPTPWISTTTAPSPSSRNLSLRPECSVKRSNSVSCTRAAIRCRLNRLQHLIEEYVGVSRLPPESDPGALMERHTFGRLGILQNNHLVT